MQYPCLPWTASKPGLAVMGQFTADHLGAGLLLPPKPGELHAFSLELLQAGETHSLPGKDGRGNLTPVALSLEDPQLWEKRQASWILLNLYHGLSPMALPFR